MNITYLGKCWTRTTVWKYGIDYVYLLCAGDEIMTDMRPNKAGFCLFRFLECGHNKLHSSAIIVNL